MTQTKVLKDVRGGYELPWRAKKQENLVYANYLNELGYLKAKNVRECGEVLQFAIDENGQFKLHNTWFCKSRLCPMCAWRRRLKLVSETSTILDRAMLADPKSEFLFLTLTLKNAELGGLKEALQALHQGFNRLMKYKRISNIAKGYIRSTEITINRKNKQYHPHLHVMLMVPKDYSRRKQYKRYVSQEEWVALWRRALQINYDPVVNIKKVRARKRKNGTESGELAAAKEVAKYQVKSKEYLTGQVKSDLVYLDELESALRNTRQFGYGGLLKEIRQQLLDEEESENGKQKLDHIESEIDDDRISRPTVMFKWAWALSNYIEFKN